MNDFAQDLYLKDEFKYGPNCGAVYKTSLTKKWIIFEAKTDEVVHKIWLGDVIGAKLSRQIKASQDELVFLHIYSYPLRKKRFRKSLRRYRVENVFCVDNNEDLNKNIAVAEKWVKTIMWLLTRNSDQCPVKEVFPPKQQFLVMINPFGGQGSALKLFNKKVKPMLEEANVNYELKVTEYAGHAKEILQNIDVTALDCILCCSGDGLIHEVVNGLMTRADWQDAIKTPLGHIPCGSGNGLCAAVAHYAGEPFDVTSSVFATLHGSPVPLDIVKAETCESKVHYSFLGVVCGIIADVDIESEKFRFMGSARFTWMAFKKIVNRRCFSGKVWYLPIEDCDNSSSGTSCSSQVNESQPRTLQSGCGESVHGSNVTFKEKRQKRNDICKYGTCIPNVHLPDVQDSIPDSWKFIEGNFIGWSFVTLSHIGKEAHIVPGAQFGAGIIHCVCFSGDATRKDMLEVMNKLEKGEHMHVHGLYIIKARAFRLEAYSTQSKIITIDGEQVEYGRIQAEIYKGLGRVKCRQTVRVQ